MVFEPVLDSSRQSLSLNGDWQYAADPHAEVDAQNWDTLILEETTSIPASFAEQGIGDPLETGLLGGWVADYAYEGKVWYSRKIHIPQELQNRNFSLVLRGVRWRSDVWIDGAYAGSRESLSTPHRYDVTALIKPGHEQRIIICVDNSMIYPLQEGHINSAETATRWGGITGGVELVSTPITAIDKLRCIPDVAAQQFQFQVDVHHVADGLKVEVAVKDTHSGAVFTASSSVDGDSTSLVVKLGDEAHLWSDVDPFLYEAHVTLLQNDNVLDTLVRKVGLREISREGKHILLNGKPVFLRGYVDCCIFPQTGYPSWDVDDYRRQFQIARSYGFNHVRLHSWTPPEPFWQAADEAGMLVQTELPHWTRFYDYAEVAAPQDVQRFFMDELEAILQEIQTHPSWVLFSNGNELIGSAAGHPDLASLLNRGKELDPTRLYTDNTGFGRIPAPNRDVDFYIQSCNWHPPKKIYDAASADTTQDFSAIMSMADAPVLGHEHGQFTMYARPSEAEKYKGVIRPTWLDSIQETLQAKQLTDRLDDFIQASGIHIARTYKENIERARRTQGLAGLQLLDIRDFPGQGHATTGILDMFWDSKGLIEPEAFAQFNGAVTLLMRRTSPTFWVGDVLTFDVDVSNYGEAPITDATLTWALRDRKSDLTLNGEVETASAPVGDVTFLSKLRIPTPADGAARAWELTLSLGNVHNIWHLWSYPYPQKQTYPTISSRIDGLRDVLPGADFSDTFAGTSLNMSGDARTLKDAGLAIADRLSNRLLQYLVDGGRVWLMPDSKQLYDFVRTRYLPPFWSYLHFPDNVSSVMGMILHSHPALDNFPHDGFSDWQWYDLVNDTPAICLDALPFIQPLVEVVDNFNRAKRLAYAFEASVGRGRLFVSTWRLYDRVVMGKPEAQYLMRQTVDYLLSDGFAPESKLSVGQVLGLFKLTNGLVAELE